MASWILGLALGVLAAVLAVAYLWLVRRPETENAAGLRAVADLRWREFATIVGQAMQQRGLRVPDDVKVVGFDDIAGADAFLPALTTVRQDFARVGELAGYGNAIVPEVAAASIRAVMS